MQRKPGDSISFGEAHQLKARGFGVERVTSNGELWRVTSVPPMRIRSKWKPGAIGPSGTTIIAGLMLYARSGRVGFEWSIVVQSDAYKVTQQQTIAHGEAESLDDAKLKAEAAAERILRDAVATMEAAAP